MVRLLFYVYLEIARIKQSLAMKKSIGWIGGTILFLVGFYLAGPSPVTPVWNPVMPSVPQTAGELEAYVANQESKHKVKPDNEARIVWADSTKQKTKYSVVYLHGYSASQGEGDPVHKNFAKEFGCNLYLARLAEHGVDTTENLLYMTPDRLWASSKEALAIGKVIGENVIIMSTSTGGTMALILAGEYPDDVFALLNMSPNITINDPLAWIGNNHWGLQLARIVKGGDNYVPKVKPGIDVALNNKYWNEKYRFESVCQLEELVEDKMNKATFEKVKQPCLNLYYYKDEEHQDKTVKVSAILEMHQQLATPDSLKVAMAIPNAGGHVMGSYVCSDDIPGVQQAMQKFAIEKLKMKPVL